MPTKLQTAANKVAGSAPAVKTTPSAPAAKKVASNGTAGTALAERPTGGGALVAGPINFEQDAGMGMEGADKDSFALPFLAILQGLSPQLKTVSGARPGLIINTVTNELFESIHFVPVAFQRRYNRWVPRDQGGGFKGPMTVAEVEQLMANGQTGDDEKLGLTFEGDQLKDTRNHFVMLLDSEGGFAPALISLASTQIKRSKRLMSMIQTVQVVGAGGRKFNPPSFANVFSAKSETEKNNKGEFESWNFERVGPVEDAELYNAAKAFHAQVTAGQVVVAPPPSGVDPEELAGSAGSDGGKKF